MQPSRRVHGGGVSTLTNNETKSEFVVLRQTEVDWRSYGPVEAVSPKDAIETVAAGYRVGDLVYAPKGQGRYVAVPLDVWQDGAFEHTKVRETKRVKFPKSR